MQYAIPLWDIPSLPIEGTNQRFPVRRIFCVGQNYAAHAREMGNDPERQPPFFFSKPADSLEQNGSKIPYPKATQNFHYEVELVLAIHKDGKNVSEEESLSLIYGYAVGIDFTRRDLQALAKKNGKPWEAAKSFEQSAPCSSIIPVSKVSHRKSGTIQLSVNGRVQQQGNLADMIWPVSGIIVEFSKLFTLKPGDLIFTGTPSGVGAVQRGDQIIGKIEGIGEVHVTIHE